MAGFYDLQSPYTLNTYINNLGPYTLTEGLDRLLDAGRMVNEAQSYYWLGIPFPGAQQAALPAYGNYSGTLTVPELAYVISLTGVAIVTATGAVATAGFKFRMYDKGGKIDSFINTQFAGSRQFLQEQASNPLDSADSNPTGPYLLDSPMIVLPPGALQLEVTNLTNLPVTCQVLIQLAVPSNRQSTNEMMIGKTNPPSGSNLRDNVIEGDPTFYPNSQSNF
jgi:hypothetical protein